MQYNKHQKRGSVKIIIDGVLSHFSCGWPFLLKNAVSASDLRLMAKYGRHSCGAVMLCAEEALAFEGRCWKWEEEHYSRRVLSRTWKHWWIARKLRRLAGREMLLQDGKIIAIHDTSNRRRREFARQIGREYNFYLYSVVEMPFERRQFHFPDREQPRVGNGCKSAISAEDGS